MATLRKLVDRFATLNTEERERLFWYAACGPKGRADDTDKRLAGLEFIAEEDGPGNGWDLTDGCYNPKGQCWFFDVAAHLDGRNR